MKYVNTYNMKYIRMQIPVQVFVYHITTIFLHVSWFFVWTVYKIFKTNFLFWRTMYLIFPSVKLEKLCWKEIKRTQYDNIFISALSAVNILFCEFSLMCYFAWYNLMNFSKGGLISKNFMWLSLIIIKKWPNPFIIVITSSQMSLYVAKCT